MCLNNLLYYTCFIKGSEDHLWNPREYAKFQSERSQPFFDLMVRIRSNPNSVVDLGCGTGDLTATLISRWPSAEVVGVDSSPEMIARASVLEVPNRLTFRLIDMTAWEPVGPIDLIVSNAALQWIPDHVNFIKKLIGWLSLKGVIAFQVPGNFDAPSHRIIDFLTESPKWCPVIGENLDKPRALNSATDYVNLLAEMGFNVSAWETTYIHVLQGEDPVLEWTKGTTLRPILKALSPRDQSEFLTEYAQLLRGAYPKTPFGTLFPFRRIFVIASLVSDASSDPIPVMDPG